MVLFLWVSGWTVLSVVSGMSAEESYSREQEEGEGENCERTEVRRFGRIRYHSQNTDS